MADYFKNRARYDGVSGHCRDCHMAIARREVERVKAEVFKKLGGKCLRCGYLDRRALQVDHVNGDGWRERQIIKGPLNFYKKVFADTTGMYQLLCGNCNIIKRMENGEHRKRYREA